jgi:hypothetical protein
VSRNVQICFVLSAVLALTVTSIAVLRYVLTLSLPTGRFASAIAIVAGAALLASYICFLFIVGLRVRTSMLKGSTRALVSLLGAGLLLVLTIPYFNILVHLGRTAIERAISDQSPFLMDVGVGLADVGSYIWWPTFLLGLLVLALPSRALEFVFPDQLGRSRA